jgi:hypothetical protein
MKIKFTCSWCSDSDLRSGAVNGCSEDGNFKWKDLEAVDSDNYDYAAVFNYSPRNIDYKRAILFHCEPTYIRSVFASKNRGGYMFDYEVQKYHSMCFNFIKTPYRELIKTHPVKTKVLSSVISHLYEQHNHVSRRDFLLNHMYK